MDEPDIAYPLPDDDNAAAYSPRRRLKVARIAAGLYSQAIVAPPLPEALSRRFVITRRPSYPKSSRAYAAYPIIICFPRALA